MRHSILTLIALALASVACTLGNAVPPTPTLVPTPFAPSPTLSPSPSASPEVPSPVPMPTLVESVSLPTSTAVRLNSQPGFVNPSAPTLMSFPGLPTVASSNGAWAGDSGSPLAPRTVDVEGASLQLPSDAGSVPYDYDVSRSGHSAVINQAGTLIVDGAAYNGSGHFANKRFTTVRWSPDGRWLAFVVYTASAETDHPGCPATHDDGLWILDSATPNASPQQIYRHHYNQPCDGDLRTVQDLSWASDNDAMMLTVRYPTGLALVLVGKGVHADDQKAGLFNLLTYASGTWQSDGQGYVTVTNRTNRASVLGILHRDVGQFTTVADGAALNVYMQNPVQLPDGRYAFLGKPAIAGQPVTSSGLMLYILTPGGIPGAVSQPLPGDVIRASWSPNRAAVAVVLSGQTGLLTFVITLDGTIRDYSADARGSFGPHWGS